MTLHRLMLGFGLGYVILRQVRVCIDLTADVSKRRSDSHACCVLWMGVGYYKHFGRISSVLRYEAQPQSIGEGTIYRCVASYDDDE
jgi:hypothetical protein